MRVRVPRRLDSGRGTARSKNAERARCGRREPKLPEKRRCCTWDRGKEAPAREWREPARWKPAQTAARSNAAAIRFRPATAPKKCSERCGSEDSPVRSGPGSQAPVRLPSRSALGPPRRTCRERVHGRFSIKRRAKCSELRKGVSTKSRKNRSMIFAARSADQYKLPCL
jgi:hypothetical protein